MSLLPPFLTVELLTCGANVHDWVGQKFTYIIGGVLPFASVTVIKVDQDSQIEIMKAWSKETNFC